jgi:WD40 repeat protein
VFEADFESEPPYIAMRLVRGDSIRQHIQRAMLIRIGELDAEHDPHLPCFPKGDEELFTILRVFERLARALHAAHEDNVIHRDIKPANVIIDESGTPMILDFGLARVGGEESSTLTLTGEVFGTPAYMPPELLRGLVSEPGPSLDVYALAITLYECLTLKRPFDAGTPEAVYKQILEDEAPSVQEFHPDLPREVAIVIATAIEKDLNRRYASALDFAEELRRICEHEPIVAIPAGLGLRLKRWLQRHPALGTSIAGSIVILVVGLTISLVLLDRVAQERDKKELLIERYKEVYYREEARKKLKADPVHALLLATEAYRRDPIEINHLMIRRAMDFVHEVERVVVLFGRDDKGTGYIQEVAPHPTESWVFYHDLHNNLWFHDLDSGQTRKIIEDGGENDGMRVTYDEAGSNLFVSRNHGEGKAPWFTSIEVRTPNGEEVRHSLGVEGEKLRRLDHGSARVVTACSDGRTLLWDTETGEVVYECTEEGFVTVWAALDPSEELLAVGLTPQDPDLGPSRLEVWDLRAERRVTPLGMNMPMTRGGEWSSSGERLFTRSEEVVSLWSLPKAELVATLEHDATCRGGRYSADGSLLVTIAEEGEVRVWDGWTGDALHELVGHDERAIIDFSFCRGEGDLFQTTSFDQTVRVWNVRSGEHLRVLRGAQSRLTASWWVEDSDGLQSLEEKGILHTWTVADPRWPRVLSASEGEVNGAWFAGGGDHVVLSTNAENMEIVEWRKGDRLESHSWSVQGVEVDHVDDERGVVVARTGGEPRMIEWSWRTGVERTIGGSGPDVVEVVPFGEGDSRHLLVLDSDEVETWDFDTDRLLFTIDPTEEPTALVQAVVSGSGRLLATGAQDGFVRVWDADSGELVRELGPFEPHNGNKLITALTFSLDEESVFAASGDARTRQWLIDTGDLLGETTSYTANRIAQIGDSHLFLSAQYSGRVILLDLRRDWSLLGGPQTVDSRTQSYLGIKTGDFAISRDGMKMLFTDARSPVRLLDTRDMMPDRMDLTHVIRGSFSMEPQVEEETEHLSSAIFSPDGQLVLAVGSGRAWLWPTDILPAAEEVSPVGIEFFGGFPSLGLSEDSVK